MTNEARPLTFPLIRVPPTGSEAIVLQTGEDGAVSLVGGWPETAVFGLEVFDQADPALLWRTGDRIHLRVANGEADYLVTDEDELTMMLTASRLYGRRDDP